MNRQAIHDHFIEQARWNAALGSPFTADLLKHMADDLVTGGPIASICADWTGNPRKDALGLRILGAVHYAVLSGEVPKLVAIYPPSHRTQTPTEVWPAVRDWLSNECTHVRQFISRPPQTNETRRSIALLPGFLQLAHRFSMPMDIFELGASAGLNQNWDRFNYQTDTWSRSGSSNVTIKTKWAGPAPQLDQTPIIRSRAACDQNPLDIMDPEQARRLTCYTWPDQPERLERLAHAISLARETGINIDTADAEDWLRDKLKNRPRNGLTVIYHSVFLIYPPRAKITRIMNLIKAAGEASTPENPLAWLSYESEALFGGNRTSPKMRTRLQVWPSGDAEDLTESDGHVTHVTAL